MRSRHTLERLPIRRWPREVAGRVADHWPRRIDDQFMCSHGNTTWLGRTRWDAFTHMLSSGAAWLRLLVSSVRLFAVLARR